MLADATPQRSSQQAPLAGTSRWGCFLVMCVLLLLFCMLAYFSANLFFDRLFDSDPDSESNQLTERFFIGDRDARDKIAVIRVTGIINEAGIRYPLRQLEQAARDKRVKAVVLRIDSPGGTVSASEELYQNILNLRDNNGRRFKSTAAKPVHVSMGAVAASGGYYIAVAGETISVEKTTITGSIGVFVALPNVAELAQKHGVRLELIKAGGVKASGSFFHELSPQERQTWQDIVDECYNQFLTVISTNRPALTRARLQDANVIDRVINERDEKGNLKLDAAGNLIEAKYTRKLADGGTFTGAQALEFGLADRLEDLPATIRFVAEANGISKYRAITYERVPSLVERFTGLPLSEQKLTLDAIGNLGSALRPRLYYLAPSSESALLTNP